MTDREKLLQNLYKAVIEGDTDLATQAAQQYLAAELSPLDAIEQGLAPAIREMGERFARMEAFLPEMLISSEAMDAALLIIKPHLTGDQNLKKGRVLIGTIRGDIHDLGKNIVVALLQVNGYEVIDLGRDVHQTTFIDEAEKVSADIVGMSGLLTTSLPLMREVIQIMRDDGVREKFKVIIGGGPTSQEFADRIGADGYATNAADSVLLCDRILGIAA